MKFMLMMHAPQGDGDWQVSAWPPADLKAHIEFMKRFDEELTDSGELVGGEGLAGPGEAKIVRAGSGRRAGGHRRPLPGGEGVPRRLLDRRRRERRSARTRIAARASAAPGPGGVPLNMPIEVRQVMSAPARGAVSRRGIRSREHLLRELAPQVLGAVVRRFGDFAAAEDAVQEALLAAALQWPREGLPDNPRGWLIQVAARRMTDHVRSEIARRRRETVAAAAGRARRRPPPTPATPTASRTTR